MAIVGPSTPPSGDYQPPKERSGIFKRMSAFVSKIFGRQGPYDVSPPQPPTPLSDEAKAIIEKLRQRGIAVTKNDEEDINIFCKTLIEQRDKEAPAGEVGGYTTTIGRSFSTFNEKGELIPVKERKPIRVTITPNPNGRDIDVTLAGDELSKGGFGKVQQVTNLYGTESLVAKAPRTDLTSEAQKQEATESLIHEGKISAKIYENETLQVTGLPPPSALADSRFTYHDAGIPTQLRDTRKGKLYLKEEQQPENPTEIARISNQKLPGQRSTLLLAKRYDGDLFDVDLTNYKPEDCRSIFAQVAQGLAFLHGKNIVHKDLKPANILVRGSGDDLEAVITDFGGAVLVDPEEMQKSDWFYTGIHSSAYTVLSEQLMSSLLVKQIKSAKATIANNERAAERCTDLTQRAQIENTIEETRNELTLLMTQLQELNKQQDVFALCLMIVQKTGLMNLVGIGTKEETGYIVLIWARNGLKDALISKLGLKGKDDADTIAQLIVNGLNLNVKERPSAEKIAAALSPYLGSPPPTI